MLASFKQKLNAPAPSKRHWFTRKSIVERPSNPFSDVESTTPEGSPAPNILGSQPPANGAASGTPAQSAPDTSSILKALADMAKQNTAAPAAPAVTAPANPLGAYSAPSVPQSDPATLNGQAGVNPYAAGSMTTPFAALSMAPTQSQSHTPPNPLAANPLAALLPQATAAPAQQTPSMVGPDALQQQLQLLQLLAAQGIPQEQWATALQILSLSNASNMANMNAPQVPGFNFPGQNVNNAWGGRADSQTRDFDRERERERDYMRSPPNQYRRRSRSPGGWDRRRDVSPPRRRDSPVYGEYHGDSPGRRGGDPRGRRGNDYRQRSPPGRRRRSPSPRKDPALPPPGPKLIEWDYSIGQGCIKGECPILAPPPFSNAGH